MADLQPWALALLLVAATIVGVYLLWRFILLLAPSWYRSMIAKNTGVSVDDFVGGPPSPTSAFKSWLLNYFQVGSRVAKSEGYALKTEDSDKVPGLKVTSRNENGASSVNTKSKPPVVVGTIRMGFGHHRIAYAATSWGLGGDYSDDRETW